MTQREQLIECFRKIGVEVDEQKDGIRINTGGYVVVFQFDRAGGYMSTDVVHERLHQLIVQMIMDGKTQNEIENERVKLSALCDLESAMPGG